MKKCTSILIITLLLTAGPTFASPLAKSRVSADADWVVHANIKLLTNTELGKLIRAQAAEMGAEEKLTSFSQIFGFHPLDDIQNVTIYGVGTDENKGVAVIDGNINPDTLITVVSMNPMHEELTHGEITIHKWLDESKEGDQGVPKSMYGCIYKGKTVVLSRGLDAVKKAVDVLDGKVGNAAGSFNNPNLNAPGAFIQVAANNVAKIAGQQGQAAVFKQAETISLATGEVEKKFFISATLTATTQEAAQNIGKMVEGIIAFASMAGQEQPQLPQLAQAVKLSYQGNAVNLRFETESSKVFSLLKEQWQKNENKKQKEPTQ